MTGKTGLMAVAINACKLASQHVPEDEVQDLELAIKQLELLLTHIKSDQYECPICLYQGSPEPDLLTLLWEVEYDDYYPISRWPYLEGTCGDTPFVNDDNAVVIRDSSYRLNHAERINQQLVDMADSADMSRILGQSAERRRLREVLGVK